MVANQHIPSLAARTLGTLTVTLLLIVATAVTSPLSATVWSSTVTGFAAAPDGTPAASTVVIRARGSQGTENMELRINGRTVAAWHAVGTVAKDFEYKVEEHATVTDIRVVFTNDGGWPDADRNLWVEHIVIDGEVHASEAGTTWSNGSWSRDSACAAGSKRSQWLHCTNAFFQYRDANGTTLIGPHEASGSGDGGSDTVDPSVVAVIAHGAQGTENMELRLNGDPVASWEQVGTAPRRFEHRVGSPATIESIQVRFLNDGGWPDADRNLHVDRIEIDGVVHQSEAAATHSVGSWSSASRCDEGFKQSQWLHCSNARFDYRSAIGTVLGGEPAQPDEPDRNPGDEPDQVVEPDDETEVPSGSPSTDPSTIVVRAAGARGTEAMELRLNGEVVASWVNVGTAAKDHVHVVDSDETIETLQVRFTNDGGWPDADRNLFVDHVTVDGVAFQSEAGTTHSVGSWSLDSGCREGVKRSQWLHCTNATFTYAEAVGVSVSDGGVASSEGETPQAPPNPTADRPHLLVMTKASVFTHPSIQHGADMLGELAAANDFDLTFTEDSAIFLDPETVERHQAVLFLNTDSVVFDTAAEKQAFRSYIDAGRGFIGIHGAAATHWRHDPWDWYRDLVGQRFVDHPRGDRQAATVHVIDPDHDSTAHLPSAWSVKDEWYNFEAQPSDVNVLLTVDESTYVGGTMGDPHPVAWNHRFGLSEAPVWYTNLGHEPELYQDPLYRDHVLGGIRWVLTVTG